MKTINGFFIGFLLGGAVGGTLALLYAPKSGKHFRQDISTKTNDLLEEGKKITIDSWNGVKEKTESTIENVNKFLKTGKEKIAGKTDKVKESLIAGVNAYNKAKILPNSQNNMSEEKVEITHK
ncbi:MAG: YtxH domain-containing protein [Ignavibacteria bacterium]|nr:YtxH domain-containing protein [Ignavibacteria bacterium]